MKGNKLQGIISGFLSFFLIVSSSMVFNPVVVEATSTDSNNGDWNAENVTVQNTNEADLMVRVGAINNFGFGWSSGFNPFSGSTVSHNFPFPSQPSNNPNPTGINTIMVTSGGYAHNLTNAQSNYSNGYSDGYSCSYYPSGYSASNYPLSVAKNSSVFGNGVNSSNKAFGPVQAITINYPGQFNFTDPTATNYKYMRNAVLQLFVDDFQAGSTSAITNPNASSHRFLGKYHFTINGVEIQQLSDEINSLNQSGPTGQLITLRIPDDYLNLLKSGSIQIKIDDPTTTNYADGYAINFAKLLINDNAISDYGTVKGKVTDSSNNAISGATVTDSYGDTVTTATDGTYTLSKVPSGMGMFTASAKNYQNFQENSNVTTSMTTTVNFALAKNTVQTPTITQSPNNTTPTNSPVTITVGYSNQNLIPASTLVYYKSTTETVPSWKSYTGPFQVAQDQTVKAEGQNSDASITSNIATNDVYNIKPNTPTITETAITNSTHKTITVNFANSNGLDNSDEIINYQGITDASAIDHHVTGSTASFEISKNQTITANTVTAFTASDGSIKNITSDPGNCVVNDISPDQPQISYVDDGPGKEKVTIDFTNNNGSVLSEYDINYKDEAGNSGNHVITGANTLYPKYTFDVNISQTITAYSKDAKPNESASCSLYVTVKTSIPIFTETAATDNTNNKIVAINFGDSTKYKLKEEHVTLQAAGESVATDHKLNITPNVTDNNYEQSYEVSKDQQISAYSIDSTSVQGISNSYNVVDVKPTAPTISESVIPNSTNKTVTITYPNDNGGSLVQQQYALSVYGQANLTPNFINYTGSFVISRDQRVTAQSETDYITANPSTDHYTYSNQVISDIIINPDKPTITVDPTYISASGSNYKRIIVNFTNNNGQQLSDEYINITTVDPISGNDISQVIHKMSTDTDFATIYSFIINSTQTITASDKDVLGYSSNQATLSLSFIDKPIIGETKASNGLSATGNVTFTSSADTPVDEVDIGVGANYVKKLLSSDISQLTPISSQNGINTYNYVISDPAALITLNGTTITATAVDNKDSQRSELATFTVTNILPSLPTISIVRNDEATAAASISYTNTNGSAIVSTLYRIVTDPTDGSLSNNISDPSWQNYTQTFTLSQTGYVQAIDVDSNGNVSNVATSSEFISHNYVVTPDGSEVYVAPVPSITNGINPQDNIKAVPYNITDGVNIVPSSQQIIFTISNSNAKFVNVDGVPIVNQIVNAGATIYIEGVASGSANITGTILLDNGKTQSIGSIPVEVGIDVNLR